MEKQIFYGWWVVFACFLLSLYIGGVIFFGFTAFFVPLREEFGWSYTQISLASSLRGLEMGIWAPIVGFLVDRYGARKIIIFGVITVGFGFFLLARTHTLIMFYGAFLLLSLGAGGCTAVALTTVISKWFTKNLGKAMGIMASGFGASGLIVPVIVYLIDLFGWRMACIYMGVGMWIIGVPTVLIIRNNPEEKNTFPDGLEPEKDTTVSSRDIERDSFGLREIVTHRTFIYLNLSESIRLMILTAVTLHIMPYLNSIGVSRSLAAFVAAAIPLSSIIGRVGLGWVADKFEKRIIMAIAFILIGFGMITISFIHIVWLIPLFLLTYPPGFGGSMVVRGAILQEYFRKDIYGRLVGIIMGSAAVGGIIGPSLAGLVFDVFGDYRILWLGFSIIIFCALYLVLRVTPLRRA